jgi:hypothetical protein
MAGRIPRTAADILQTSRAQDDHLSATPVTAPFEIQFSPYMLSEPSLEFQQPSFQTISWQHTPASQFTGPNPSELAPSFFTPSDSLPHHTSLFDLAAEDFDDLELANQLNALSQLESMDTDDIGPLSEGAWSTHSRSSTSTSSASPLSQKSKRLSHAKRMKVALAYLRLGRLGPIDLLAHILDPSIAENDRYRTLLYKEDGRLGEILDMVMEDARGRERLELWMKQPAIDLVCTIVDREMDAAKNALRMKLEDVTPDYISKWTVETTSGVIVQQYAPVLHHFLIRAAQSDKAKAKNKNKMPDMVRSLANIKLTVLFHGIHFER